MDPIFNKKKQRLLSIDIIHFFVLFHIWAIATQVIYSS